MQHPAIATPFPVPVHLVPPEPDPEIGAVACRVEAELRFVAEAWDHLDAEQRHRLAHSLSVTAPGVLQLLCPAYGRFNRSA